MLCRASLITCERMLTKIKLCKITGRRWGEGKGPISASPYVHPPAVFAFTRPDGGKRRCAAITQLGTREPDIRIAPTDIWISKKSGFNITKHDSNNHCSMAIIHVNRRQLTPPVKNWTILLVQSFTAHMLLLTASSAYALGKRCCYLHCLRT